ncbi:MAG: hypothetical protein OXR66_02360 [Candidatus Woesearchaeota archaeon]|nr:hypothetical protein [Candidatus Woesearchaeota archaeon]
MTEPSDTPQNSLETTCDDTPCKELETRRIDYRPKMREREVKQQTLKHMSSTISDTLFRWYCTAAILGGVYLLGNATCQYVESNSRPGGEQVYSLPIDK